MGLLTGGRVNCGKEPDQLDNVSQTEWGGRPRGKGGRSPVGKVWEDKGSLQGGPKRTGGALLRREAAGSLGPGHKMAAAPLGLLVQDRGAAVR